LDDKGAVHRSEIFPLMSVEGQSTKARITAARQQWPVLSERTLATSDYFHSDIGSERAVTCNSAGILCGFAPLILIRAGEPLRDRHFHFIIESLLGRLPATSWFFGHFTSSS
jgi:hypothetical protein